MNFLDAVYEHRVGFHGYDVKKRLVGNVVICSGGMAEMGRQVLWRCTRLYPPIRHLKLSKQRARSLDHIILLDQTRLV